jgi:RNA polymerase sigma factor (sigma-70 family)
MLVAEFNHLLAGNTEFLKPFAITFTRNREEASDLLQETFCKALSNREKYNSGTNIRAWLYTIMKNIFINSSKKKYAESLIFDDSPEYANPDYQFSSSMDGESIVYYKEIQQSVWQLPETVRTPFVLMFDGYKYHEISYILREPVGTIKSRIHAARKALRASVERH